MALAEPACDAQVAELKATMQRSAERERQGRFTLKGVGPLLTVPFDARRASTGSHEGVVLRATEGGFHVGLPSTFEPVPFVSDVPSLVAAVSRDRNWSFGKSNGIERLLHYNVAVPPDVPWWRVRQAVEAAAQLQAASVTFVLAHDDAPLEVERTALHSSLTATKDDMSGIVSLIRSHFAACGGVGRGLGKLAGKFPHNRATAAAELLPAAFTECACAVPPADFAEVWVVLQTDELWAVDQAPAKLLELDLDPDLPWSKAAKKVLRSRL